MDVALRERGVFAFGGFRLDPVRRTLMRRGQEVALTARLFDTLLYLVQNPERLVTREEIETAVWGGRVVEEGNLQKAVSSLRKALLAEDGAASFVATVPGRGYRFAVPVSFEPELQRIFEPDAALQAAGTKPVFAWPPPGDPDRAPYRGLRALEAEDAAIFFGREAAIIRGMDQLSEMAEQGADRLMLVLGASGSGKSSFLRAGLWPRLALDEARFLPLPVIRPLDAAITGASGLAASLSGAFTRLGKVRPPGPVKAALAAGGASAIEEMVHELAKLAQARRAYVDASAQPPKLVLPIDQTEELFSSEGAAEAENFLAMLASMLTGDGSVLAIGTIRTEHYHRMQSEGLLSGVRRVLFDLPPIPEFEYRQVVEGPAQVSALGPRGFTVEPALTERLIGDATGADALPLLALTLERLWTDYGAQGRLALDDYTAMGGVKGSIEAAVTGALSRPKHAPSIASDKAAQNAALRAAFIPWLVRVDPASRTALRRGAPAEKIPLASRAYVDRFVAARLLVADRRDGVDIIEVAHESLLRQWPSLAAWLTEDAEALAQIEEVERAASEWVRNGRRDPWLDHRADRLVAAEALLRREDFRARLDETGIAYVAAARAAEERDHAARALALAGQARTQRAMWWALAAVGVVLALGLGSAVLQLRANRRMQAQLEMRQTALDRAEVARLVTISAFETEKGQLDPSLRISVLAARRSTNQNIGLETRASATAQLRGTLWQSRWRLVIAGHTGLVYGAAYSPDGTHIVTASPDHTARIWDAATARQITVLQGHADFVMSAAYSPDGTRIVTASLDHTARIWDAATGQQVAVLAHADKVYSAAYSPDGTRIVTASYDHTARIWDVMTGKQIEALNGHSDVVTSAAFSPDGTHVVTASNDHTARLWNAATGRGITVLSGHSDIVNFAAYSPDGTHIVTASDDNTARIWDAATGRQIAVLKGHTEVVLSAIYSRDGTRIVTASSDHTARIWDAATGWQIAVLNAPEKLYSATYSPDGTHIVTTSQDRTARIWDAAPGPQIAVLNGHTDLVRTASYSLDGTRIVTASADHTARIWDLRTRKQIVVLTGHTDYVRDAAYSPDATRIATASDDGTARIWDAATGRQIAVLTANAENLLWVAYRPDGARIVTASADRTARVWDATTGQQIMVLNGHGERVLCAAYSPDGARIVTASVDGTARIWDAATGRQITVLNGHTDRVYTAAYSPDGTRIVTASEDLTARVWDAATGRQIAVLIGHTVSVLSAAYSPDGTRIVTAGGDHTARVWDGATGRQIAVLSGHTSNVVSAAFSPDGTSIVTASADRTARIWDVRGMSLPVPRMLAEACGRQLMGVSKLTEAEMTLIGEESGGSLIDVCDGIVARP
jgi:WD40 repeat protein/DNA-binding winged helix-turn-helix (wHTH) protein